MGNILSSDIFYNDNPEANERWARMGVLAVEMESAGLYACAAAEGGEALTVLTVSDHLFDGSKDMSSDERETLYANSVRLAAAALLA